MDRSTAIQIINSLYPADSRYPGVRTIGEELLAQARREVDERTWKDEPTPVLVRYAELCKRLERAAKSKQGDPFEI